MAAASILWLVLAAAVQLVWGWYPAALRFLQTKAPHKLTSLQLSTLINVFPLPVVLIQSLLLWSHGVAYRRGHAAALEAQHKRDRATPAGPSGSLQEPLLAGAAEGADTPANGEVAVANGTVHAEDAGLQPSKPSLWKKAGFLAITTTSLTSLMVSQIFALLFVEVCNVGKSGCTRHLTPADTSPAAQAADDAVQLQPPGPEPFVSNNTCPGIPTTQLQRSLAQVPRAHCRPTFPRWFSCWPRSSCLSLPWLCCARHCPPSSGKRTAPCCLHADHACVVGTPSALPPARGWL